MSYNAIIMVTPPKIDILKISFPYLLKNLGNDLNKIILVANDSNRPIIEKAFGNENRVEFLNEEAIMEGLTLAKIKSIMYSICGKTSRAGWYYQQFLKMAYSYICRDDFYLVFDSDTIPLHPIPYFGEDKKPSFITKIEYHKPYFDTIEVLFDGKVSRVNEKESFIAENMMISKTIMQEMIERIMSNDHLTGMTFYERIMHAIDSSIIRATGFSEFETYGNYVMTYHSDEYHKIKLRTQRLGAFIVGDHPTAEQLEWVSHDYDIISIEPFGRRWLAKYTMRPGIRTKYSARELFLKYIKYSDFLDQLRGKKVIQYDEQ